MFVIGSALCSVAPGLAWLVAFRMVQGIGGCMLNPVAMSIITNVFTDRRERAFAIGVWGGVIGIGLGLVAGGELIESVGWRGIVLAVSFVAAASLVAFERRQTQPLIELQFLAACHSPARP